MIALSSEIAVVHLILSWGDADWQRPLCGAEPGRRTTDPNGNGLDESGRPMNLCDVCVAVRAARQACRATAPATEGR